MSLHCRRCCCRGSCGGSCGRHSWCNRGSRRWCHSWCRTWCGRGCTASQTQRHKTQNAKTRIIKFDTPLRKLFLEPLRLFCLLGRKRRVRLLGIRRHPFLRLCSDRCTVFLSSCKVSNRVLFQLFKRFFLRSVTPVALCLKLFNEFCALLLLFALHLRRERERAVRTRVSYVTTAASRRACGEDARGQ
jgi:hypothetical protein